MTFLNKTRPYIFAFLVFSVASSKHIIIYNEELLVALTFLFFVIYIKVAFGNSIKNSIDESRNSILQELQSSRVHKKSGADSLKSIHEKVPAIQRSLQSIENYIYFCVSKVGEIAKKSINRGSRQQIQYRLSGVQKILQISTGDSMSESFFPGILIADQKSKNSSATGGDKNINKKNGKENKALLYNSKSSGLNITKKGISLLKKSI